MGGTEQPEKGRFSLLILYAAGQQRSNRPGAARVQPPIVVPEGHMKKAQDWKCWATVAASLRDAMNAALDTYMPWLLRETRQAGCEFVEQKLSGPLRDQEESLARRFGAEVIVHMPGGQKAVRSRSVPGPRRPDPRAERRPHDAADHSGSLHFAFGREIG